MSEGTGKRRILTDKQVKAAKARPKPHEIHDTETRGLRVRVLPGGTKTFVLVARYPRHPKNPTRRALGTYPEMSLEEARERAREWKKLVKDGTDPKEVAEERRRERQRERDNTFAVVAEEFIKRHVSTKRRAAIIEREIRDQFIGPRPWRDGIKPWGDLAITKITRDDVMAVLQPLIDRGKIYQAHNLFIHVRALFKWALKQDKYGLEVGRLPCDRVEPSSVIGKRKARSRVLTDPELRAFWNAAGQLAYPCGSLFRMLALTGQRLSEVANAVWPEFDLDKRLWTIPAHRMKMDAPHVVPLAPDAISLLESLPRFASGDCLFSNTFGKKPVTGFSKPKRRLDRLMLAELKKLEPWRTHDIRRTMRTHLSALPITDRVRELVIAHAQPGMHRIYDQYAYLNEKRQALALWAVRLRGIVEAPPDNVVPLPTRGQAESA